jgi:hypothetical protein
MEKNGKLNLIEPQETTKAIPLGEDKTHWYV